MFYNMSSMLELRIIIIHESDTELRTCTVQVLITMTTMTTMIADIHPGKYCKVWLLSAHGY